MGQDHGATAGAGAHTRQLSRAGDARSHWRQMVRVRDPRAGDAGTLRFNEIRSEVDGFSQRMLTVTLRGMERDGPVRRAVNPEVPPRVEYALTPLGKTLRQLVRGWWPGRRRTLRKSTQRERSTMRAMGNRRRRCPPECI